MKTLLLCDTITMAISNLQERELTSSEREKRGRRSVMKTLLLYLTVSGIQTLTD